MIFLIAIGVLATVFLAVAWTCEWTTARLKRPAPYTDRSRGTGTRG